MKIEGLEKLEKLGVDIHRVIYDIINSSNKLVYFKDKESRFIYVNDKFKSIYGDVIGKTDFDIHFSKHAQQAFNDERNIMRTGEPLDCVEAEAIDKNGRYVYVRTQKYCLYDTKGRVMGTFGISENVSEQIYHLEDLKKANEELLNRCHQLSDACYIDELSLLKNFRCAKQVLDDCINEYRANKTPFSIMSLDIDNFKSVNDTYGHIMGDNGIRLMGRILNNVCEHHNNCIACRMGGDEFMLIMLNTGYDEAITIAREVKELIDNSKIVNNNISIPISVSAGIAVMSDGKELAQLLEEADRYLYNAKKDGKNRVYSSKP